MASAGVRIVIVGLGYVGLPLALALARRFAVTGYDISAERIAELRRGHDRTGEVDPTALAGSSLELTGDAEACRSADLYIVTVPTPVDSSNQPDLSALLQATRAVAGMIDPARFATIVFESTVYPGVTEEICGPEIERVSGLTRGTHFRLGYSPERINPGDREHSIERITKVVAGEDRATTDLLREVYGTINGGQVFRAASIKAAEAAKVIENAQRDLNIAFMNEVTQIFARLDLSIWDVLAAARTKWNFLPFEPGLVGGHCIGVDPYYLAYCARELGHHPQTILAGRATNDGMGVWIADRMHERLCHRRARVLILGLTFKENVPDLRNSRVIDVVRRLEWLGHDVLVADPLADTAEARAEYGVTLVDPQVLAAPVNLVAGAVPHAAYRELTSETVSRWLTSEGQVADLKRMWNWRNPPFPVWTL